MRTFCRPHRAARANAGVWTGLGAREVHSLSIGQMKGD